MCSPSAAFSAGSGASTSASSVRVWKPYAAPPWFTGKVERHGDCWLWTGARTSDGYGQAKVKGQFTRMHRWAYEFFVGPVPALSLHHTCEAPTCVNPAHLEPMTQAEHRSRHAAKEARDHCPAGHPFDDQNTYWNKGKYRQCRTCQREKQAHRRQLVQRDRGL